MQGGLCHRLLVLALLLGSAIGNRAVAVNPETLLMPGKLSAAHAKYEEQCSQCHDRSDRNRQTSAVPRLPQGHRGRCARCPRLPRPPERHHHLAVPRLSLRASRARRRHRQAQPRAVRSRADRLPAAGRARSPSPAMPAMSRGKPYREAPTECVACHQQGRAARRQARPRLRSCHDAARLARSQLRPRQDRLPAARPPRRGAVRRLSFRQPLQGHAARMRLLPRA